MKRPAAHAVLFTALVLVSTSGPFLVMTGMDTLSVVFLRMASSAVLFLGWAAITGHLRVERELVPSIAAGGLLLAAHFLLWVKAFSLTNYASNLLLLVMQPVIAAFLGIRFGERPTRATWTSIGLAVVGLAIIAGGDFALGPRALVGDAMCILGDLAIALFYVVTRNARWRTPLPMFMGLTMGVGGVVLAPIIWVAGTNLGGHTDAAWGWLAALVVLTTVGGHGLMNLAARHVRLFALNVVIVLEPAIGLLIGWPLFGADVSAIQVAGGVLLAVAVVVGLRDPGAATQTAT